MQLDEILVVDKTENGNCSQCGECCSNMLPLSEKEIKDIKRYIKIHNIKEQRHNAMNGIDMTCPFRDDANRKCLIYEVRPKICRLFKCNQTKDEMLRNKIATHNANKITCMRYEFFNNDEDLQLMIALANFR